MLIALGILGVIAAFTIPKIMVSQQNQKSNAAAKEAAGMIAAAYQKLQADGLVTANTKPSDLTPYMSYVNWDTSSSTIDLPGIVTGSRTCSSSYPCVRLHNGAVLLFADPCYFAGTNTTNYMEILFDPDGVATGGGDGPSKSVMFALYTTGFLTTRDKIKPSSTSGCGTYGPASAYDPSWFSW